MDKLSDMKPTVICAILQKVSSSRELKKESSIRTGTSVPQPSIDSDRIVMTGSARDFAIPDLLESTPPRSVIRHPAILKPGRAEMQFKHPIP
jgi:hypothetical protein